MDFEKMMRENLQKALFNMENDLYNGFLAENAGEIDAETFVQIQSLVATFNRHGVSTKVVFDVFREAFGGGTNE